MLLINYFVAIKNMKRNYTQINLMNIMYNEKMSKIMFYCKQLRF